LGCEKIVLVSVVITTYNRPERIPKAIQTVLDQTFQDFEIIVVDGARSVENMNAVLKFKDKRIKYLPVEKEAVNYIDFKGIQHSRNVGCKAAIGKYIAMLDDDDLWEPTKLEKQLELMKDNVALVLCYTKIYKVVGYIIDKTLLEVNYKDLLKSYNLSSTSSYLMSKQVLEDIGYWNEELRGMHEYDIALKFAKKGYRIVTVPEVLMIRNRIANITIESGRCFFYKIAEIFDLWKYYGKDFIPHIGLKGFTFNVIKTVMLIGLFSVGYIFREGIWEIIYPLKKLYEQGVSK